MCGGNLENHPAAIPAEWAEKDRVADSDKRLFSSLVRQPAGQRVAVKKSMLRIASL